MNIEKLTQICKSRHLTYEKLKCALDKFDISGFKSVDPLHTLCKFNPKLELIKLMIERGADPCKVDVMCMDSLAYLFCGEKDFDTDVFKYLISLGCSMEEYTIFYETIPFYSVYSNGLTPKKLEIFSKYIPNFIFDTDINENSLFMAAFSSCPTIKSIKLLANYGFDIMQVNYENFNCIDLLFQRKKSLKKKLIEFLVKELVDTDTIFDTICKLFMKRIYNQKFLLKNVKLFLRYKKDIICKSTKIESMTKVCLYNLKVVDFPELNLKENYLFYLLIGYENIDPNLIRYLIKKGNNIQDSRIVKIYSGLTLKRKKLLIDFGFKPKNKTVYENYLGLKDYTFCSYQLFY